MIEEKSESMGFLFSKVSRLHKHYESILLDKLGLHFGQPPVLFLLWNEDGQTQTDIGRRLMLTPATVTLTLRRMERDGWIERRPDSRDMRVSRVYLTEKGRVVQDKVVQTLDDVENNTFVNFSKDDLNLLKDSFLKIKANLAKVDRPY